MALVVVALEREIPNTDKEVLVTGVGKVNAAIALTKRLMKGDIKKVLNFGSAGSTKFPIGDLVKCGRFVQRDMDCTGLGKYPHQTYGEEYDYLSNTDDEDFVTCYSGDSFVMDKAFDVVDMEAYALAKVCKEFDVEFHCIKVISDNADEHADDAWFERNIKDVKITDED